MNGTASLAEARPALEINVGREVIEVFLDEKGIHFRQPGGSSAQGHLAWELAIAMSLLPREVSASAA